MPDVRHTELKEFESGTAIIEPRIPQAPPFSSLLTADREAASAGKGAAEHALFNPQRRFFLGGETLKPPMFEVLPASHYSLGMENEKQWPV